jgi:hypothetical protein
MTKAQGNNPRSLAIQSHCSRIAIDRSKQCAFGIGASLVKENMEFVKEL